jgi:lipopolysaccharide transport system ATP-binding protein
MNGSILGLPRDEIDARYDEITGFADIGDFIDQPVKTYSSGMFVRLAFAVQACVEPDILVVDEALAVGDVFFRQKCYKRLAALRERGCSIILVTHAMNDVEQFCERALLLDHGEALFSGAAPEAVKRYYLVEQDSRGQGARTRAERDRPVDSSQAIPAARSAYLWPAPESFPDISGIPQIGNGWARCTGVAVCDPDGRPCRCFHQGETASFFYEFEVLQDIEVPIGGVVIQSDKGVIVHGRHSLQYGTAMPLHVVRGSRLRFRQDITLDIAVGEYTLEAGLAMIGREEYERAARLSEAEFHEKVTRLCHLPGAAHFAVAAARPGELGQPPFYGITNLPGSCQLAVEPAMEAV